MLDLMPQGGALVPADPAAVAAAEAAKARIQSAYAMAVHKPRNEDQARHNILQACKRPEFARKVEYAKPVGNTKIKGPSIRLAEEVLRSWGNILVETATVYDDEKVRRIQVTCLDLETNSSFGKQIQITKTVERSKAGADREVVGERLNSRGETVYIVRATDDELATKEAAQISKVVRNEGLRLIPSDIVDEALVIARTTLATQDSKDPEQAKKRVLDSFAALGVQPKHLEEYLGHSLDMVAPKELEELRGMFQAIKDGEASWADYLALKQAEVKPGAGDKAAQEAAARLAELYEQLYSLAGAKGLTAVPDRNNLHDYVVACTTHFKISEAEALANILPAFEEKFWPSYLTWPGCKFQPPAATPQQAPPPDPAPEAPASPAVDGAGSGPSQPTQATDVTNVELANEFQREALADLLGRMGASDRYKADVQTILGRVFGPGLAADAAMRLVDCLTVDPPVWGPFDEAMGYKAQASAKGKQPKLV